MSVVSSWLNKTPAALLKSGLFVATVMAARLLQSRNASNAMLVTLAGRVTLLTLEYENAWSAMMATLVPTVTLVRLFILKNAASPMLVIGRPLVVLGMTTA